MHRQGGLALNKSICMSLQVPVPTLIYASAIWEDATSPSLHLCLPLLPPSPQRLGGVVLRIEY